ncbi:MAG: superinfection immunity protein [Pedosphaera sp.]|nr:superinfection immunity protein [Pedosphaera sp.]
MSTGANFIDFLLLFLFGATIYFAPAIIGIKKRNSTAILALNFLLGWTFVGWVIALVWALTKDVESQKDA